MKGTLLAFLLACLFVGLGGASETVVDRTRRPDNPDYQHSPDNPNIQIAGFCELFQNSSSRDKVLVVSALMFSLGTQGPVVDGSSEDILYSPKCNNGDYFAWADYSPVAIGIEKLREGRVSSSGDPTVRKVTVKAKISVRLVGELGHLNWLRARFEIISFDSVNSRVDYPMPDFTSEAPLMDDGRSVLAAQNQLLSTVFGSSGSASSEFNTSHSKFSLNGRVTVWTDLLKKLNRGVNGRLEYKTSSVSKERDVWICRGTVSHFLGNTRQVVNFVNTYRVYEDRGITLLSMRLYDEP